VALVRERTIPTKRPQLLGEVSANFCGLRGVTWHPLSAKLAVTLPTSGFRSVGVVRSRTEATELNLVLVQRTEKNFYFRKLSGKHDMIFVYKKCLFLSE
jgi:hypothetical protein